LASKMPLLAGNFTPGTRVAGPGGTGTVKGPPSRSVLKAVAVQVSWDNGIEADERVSSLRPATWARQPRPTAGGRRPLSAGAVVHDNGQRTPKTPTSPISPGGASTPGSAASGHTFSPAARSGGAAAHSPRAKAQVGRVAPGALANHNSPASSSGSRSARATPASSSKRAASAGSLQQSDPSPNPMRGVKPGGTPSATSDLPNPMRGVKPSSPQDNGADLANPMAGVKPSSGGNSRSVSSPRGQAAGQRAPPSARSGGNQSHDDNASVSSAQIQPPQRRGKKAGSKPRTTLQDAEAHPEAGDQPNPLEIIRRHSMKYYDKEHDGPSGGARDHIGKKGRANSQWQYADPSQAMIVFDWDDTLFPTTQIIDVLKLDWRTPLGQQRVKKEIVKKLANCEQGAIEVIERATQIGHVVVVTLAARGWVEQACRLFYPKVGQLLQKLGIKIVNAQEKEQRDAVGDPSQYGSDEEYYGLLKGQAISSEIDRFYSQYEGQTWKNILSIGDSRFERYGLLAASTAYMKQKHITAIDDEPYDPLQPDAWKKVNTDGHVVHVRVKCCKLVDGPDIEELDIELDMITKWLQLMVNLDEGFDLDFESLVDAKLVAVVEGVFNGERPITDLPASPSG